MKEKKILFRLNVKCQSNVRLKAITNLFIYAIVIESKVDTKYSTRIKLKKKKYEKICRFERGCSYVWGANRFEDE